MTVQVVGAVERRKAEENCGIKDTVRQTHVPLRTKIRSSNIYEDSDVFRGSSFSRTAKMPTIALCSVGLSPSIPYGST